MSGRIFQNIVLQFKETTDTVIGVIDSEGTVIACTDLPEIRPALAASGAAHQ